MKYLLSICFIFTVGFFSGVNAAECARYMDDTYRYSVCVPEKWKKSFSEAGSINVLGLARNDGARITVSASRYEGENKKKWENWRRWYVNKVGAGFRKIIETKEIPAGDNVAIKTLVFDYPSRAGRMLQRIMLMKYGENILAVECRAPVKVFARYTDRFNAVMSSVDVSGNLQGEPMALLKAPRKAAVAVKRKRPEVIAPPKPKPKPEPAPEVIESREPEPKQETQLIQREELKPAPDSSTTGKNRPDAEIQSIEQVKPEAESKKGGEAPPESKVVDDPGTKKVIDAELKKMQELEQKGIIDKVDEQ